MPTKSSTKKSAADLAEYPGQKRNYVKNDVTYAVKFGTKVQVWNKTAYKTTGNLKRGDLMRKPTKNGKKGKVVSKKASEAALKRFHSSKNAPIRSSFKVMSTAMKSTKGKTVAARVAVLKNKDVVAKARKEGAVGKVERAKASKEAKAKKAAKAGAKTKAKKVQKKKVSSKAAERVKSAHVKAILKK